VLLILVVLLLVYIFSLFRGATVGEGSDSPESSDLAIPDFIRGVVPSAPPVPPRDVVADCRAGTRLTFAGACEARVEPGDERRRLTLIREEGVLDITVRYEPDGDENPNAYRFPQDDEERAEFGVPDDRTLRLGLECLVLQCTLRIEQP
jgi:hypothetical protein